jgi:hypothetical protein
LLGGLACWLVACAMIVIAASEPQSLTECLLEIAGQARNDKT